jgi:hypothetical protein
VAKHTGEERGEPVGGATPQQLPAEVGGNAQSNVNVGWNNRIIEINNSTIYGDVLREAPPVKLTPRAAPLELPAPVCPVLLDRVDEMAAGLRALTTPGRHVEVSGVEGVGKTSLLGHMARRAPPELFPDRAVWLDGGGGTPREDLLNELFVCFWETDQQYHPTPAEARAHLNGTRAVVVLDDLGLARHDFQWLSNKAPGCTFVVAAESPTLGGEAEAIFVGGLPLAEALELVEHELGRPLEGDERVAAAAVCEAAGGQPLTILQRTRRARAGLVTLIELATEARPADSRDRKLLAGVAMALPEQQALAALASPTTVGLAAERVAAIAGLADAATPLTALAERGLVHVDSKGRYIAAQAARSAIAELTDLTPVAERSLSYVTGWAEQTPQTPDAVQSLAEHSDTLLATLAWAADAQRWADVSRLARAVDLALTLSGRWGSRGTALRRLVAAAAALADPPTQAWAFHQLGSAAVCRGELAEAETQFGRALDLRLRLGDAEGAAVTRNNLDLIRRLTLPSDLPVADEVAAPHKTRWLAAGVGALIMLLLAGAVAVAGVVAPELPLPWLPTPTAVLPTQAPGAATRAPAQATSTTGSGTATPLPATAAPAVVTALPAKVTAAPAKPTPGGPTATVAVPTATTVALGGRGVLDPQRLSFGTRRVGTRTTLVVTLTNSGTARLPIHDVSTTGDDFAHESRCGETVQPGAACEVRVTFAPSSASERTGEVVVTLSDTARLSAPLSGTGIEPRLALELDPDLKFDPLETGKTSDPRTMRLRSTGSIAVANLTAAVTGDFAIVRQCPTQLAPGDTCQLEVTFSPTTPGARVGQLTVSSDAAGAPHVRDVSGIGVPPPQRVSAVVRPDQLAFGNQRLGGVAPVQQMTVENTSAIAFEPRLTLEGANAGDFAYRADNCSRTQLAPQRSCTATVAFTSGALGNRAASAIVSDASGARLAQTALSGTGVTAPTLRVSPTSLDFGSVNVGVSSPQQVVLTNDGPGELEVSATGVGSAAFAARGMCVGRIPAGDSCTVTVQFMPRTAGRREDQLVVQSDAQASPAMVKLSGVGVAMVAKLDSASALDFGQLERGGRLVKTLTLSSSGTAAAVVARTSVTGPGAGDFKVDDAACVGNSLTVPNTCDVKVTFTAGVIGSRSAKLEVTYNGTSSPLVITVLGASIVPQVPPTPMGLSPGSTDPLAPAIVVSCSVTLRWLPIAGMTYLVNVDRAVSPNPPTWSSILTSAKATSAGLDVSQNVVPGQVHRWNVQAQDSTGAVSPLSAWVYFLCRG